MTSQRLSLLSLIVSLLAPLACEPPVIKVPGAQLSGTVRIDASLRPLLPPPAGAQGTNVSEVEPNTGGADGTSPATEFTPVGVVTPDDPPTIISGSLNEDDVTCDAAHDCRDRHVFQVSAAASVTMVFEATGGSGTTNVFLVDGLEIGATNVLANEASDGVDPVTLTAVLEPGKDYLIQLRYLSVGELQYRVTLTAVTGAVVGKVYVGAYRSVDAHPALLPDPVRQAKNPVGAQLVEVDVQLDDAGNWVGGFKDLSVLVCQGQPLPGEPCVEAGTELNLFAFADNDGSGSTAPTNFALFPPTKPDFIASTLITVLLPADGDRLDGLELQIDATMRDLDFDGVLDEDTDGDGRADDNCATVPNLDQLDLDLDGVGDACDVCPDVVDRAQENSDGAGRGDACNQDASSACPRFFTYAVDPGANECFIDTDGDEIDDQRLECGTTARSCVPPSLKGDLATSKVATVAALDNCRDTANFSDADPQTDSDGDEQGDACDDDDDADGVDDIVDNCPLAGNAGQQDEDGDGAGDACDNCLGIGNPDQRDTDEDEFVAADGTTTLRGDACDADDDSDGLCDPGAVPAADEECAGEDNCPFDANAAPTDSDGDGIGDACDTCAGIATESQVDTDRDGLGDACDSCDGDAGTSCTADDDCGPEGSPGTCGAAGFCLSLTACGSDTDCVDAGGRCLDSGFCIAENDTDGDDTPDSCDLDADGDGAPDATDNCPGIANAAGDDGTQADVDGDGRGDPCDDCPTVSNTTQEDGDEDGLGDACDLCRFVPTGPIACTPCDANGDCGAGQICDVSFAGHTGTNECIDDPSDAILAKGTCQTAGAGACTSSGVCATDGNADRDGLPDRGDACDPDDDDDEVCDACGQAAPLPLCTTTVSSNECRGADNCPADANPADADGTQADTDEDGLGDVCDASTDDDDDGVPNNVDNCPNDANGDDDGGEPQADGDDDGVGDACDNCPDDANPLDPLDQAAGQSDGDDDGVGDACDNCPADPNPGQENADSGPPGSPPADVVGDACDLDDDNDGLTDSADNCPQAANSNQNDLDGDGVGDACDTCVQVRNANQADFDFDGDGDVCDNCPADANADQVDEDGDIVGNACDVCALVPNPDQTDNEGDGLGDICDDDDDNDTVADVNDNCPLDANTDQGDVNDDDVGDVCDPDADDDGIPNADDNCPLDDSTFVAVLVNDVGDDLSNDSATPTQLDSPSDRVRVSIDGTVGNTDAIDVFRITLPAIAERRAQVTILGAVAITLNAAPVPDAELTLSLNGLARTFEVTAVDAGVSTPWQIIIELGGDLDLDGDDIGDICDPCSLDADVGDRDNDGIDDSCDLCIVAEGNDVGSCAIIDQDNDTICTVNEEQAPATCTGAEDNCPTVANLDQPDSDNDGTGDACEDDDADGVFNPEDNCPDDENAAQDDNDGDGVGDDCDNCFDIPNGPFDGDDQGDADGDGVGDSCDSCSVAAGPDCGIVDPDEDGFCTDPSQGAGCPPDADVCPDEPDDQSDADGDGLGDACNDADDPDGDEIADGDLDNCPGLRNDDQSDQDLDFFGDACDLDRDGDGFCNDIDARDAVPDQDGQLCIGIDNCPDDKNVDQQNADSVGAGDACDSQAFVLTFDESEPNDDPASPQNLGAALVNQRFVVEGTAEGRDVFRVTAPRSGLLSLRLTFVGAGDLDLVILPGASDADFEGGQLGNPEIASTPVAAGDVVDFTVDLFEGDAAAYALEVVLVADVEPANVLSAIDAGELRIGEFVPIAHELSGTLADARGDGGLDWNGSGDLGADDEVDVYAVTCQTAGILDVNLAFGAGNDIDVIFWSAPPSADFAGLLATELGAATGANPEVESLDVAAGQTLFVSLHAFDIVAEPTGAYTLTLSLK
jgi:hypothetical protein